MIFNDMIADLSGDLMADDYIVNKLAERNAPLLKKLISRFKGTIKKSATVDSESIKYLKKLVSKFEKALDNAQGGVKISQIGNADDEREETADSSQQIADSKDDDERKSYAGIRARTANGMNLENAKKMLEQGVDAEKIRKETGWFKGYDGKWRFEIDDSQMQIKENISNYTDLEKLIDHKELFEAYPELKNVGVIFCSLDEGKGSYNRQFGYIELDYSLKGDNENLKYTLIHEIQHAIQHIEEFARGASPKYWQRKIDEGYDSRQAFVKEQERELLEIIKKKRHEDRDFIEDIEFLVDSTPNKPRGKIDWDTFEQIEEDPPEWKSYDRWRDTLSNKYGEENVFYYMDTFSKLNRLKHYGKLYAEDLYWLTAGEIEARDVSSRLDFDAEKRKNTRPDIDNSEVVFAEDSLFSRQVLLYNGQKFVAINPKSIDMLNNLPGNSLAAKVREYMKRFRGTVLPLGSTDKAYMRREAEGEYTNPAKNIEMDDYESKLNAASEFENLLQCAKYIRHQADNGRHPDATRGWNYYEITYIVPTNVGVKAYKGEIQIKLVSKGDCFYDITKIEDITNGAAGQALIKAAGSVYNASNSIISTDSLNVNSDSKKNDDGRKSVKRSYEPSSEVDSNGSELSLEQAEFFKDSKVRDKDGNLLVVYHGTMESFSVFDITKSRSYDEKLNYDLPGFYFSESNEESGGYGSAVKAYYVNVTNPYDGDTYKLAKEKGSYRKAYDYLVSQGYDGIIDTEMGEGFTEIIAFHPEQIKLITNKKPSSNPDIRYSKQRSYNPFEDVDDEGNKFVEGEDGGTRILFSMPDFDNSAYEYGHIPDEEPDILETYKAVVSSSTEADLRKRLANATKAKVYARKEAVSAIDEIMTEKGYLKYKLNAILTKLLLCSRI